MFYVSSEQRVGRVSHNTQFPSINFINFINLTKQIYAIGLHGYQRNSPTSPTNKSAYDSSISSSITANSSPATRRRETASLVGPRDRRNTLFITAGRILSTTLRTATAFTTITFGPRVGPAELAATSLSTDVHAHPSTWANDWLTLWSNTSIPMSGSCAAPPRRCD